MGTGSRYTINKKGQNFFKCHPIYIKAGTSGPLARLSTAIGGIAAWRLSQIFTLAGLYRIPPVVPGLVKREIETVLGV